MRYSVLALGLVCLSEQVSLAASKLVLRSPLQTSEQIHHARRNAEIQVSYQDLNKREPNPQSAQFDSLDSVLMPSTNATETACRDKLDALNGEASNPSGMSACYSIAAFDNSTGDFQINVLLFELGERSEGWENRENGTAQVVLNFEGAAVSDQDTVARPAPQSTPSLAANAQAQSLRPNFVLVVTSKGTVNGELRDSLTNMTRMRTALTPEINFFSQASNGDRLSVILPNTDAGFVTGALTDEMLAAVDEAPFEIPGVTLGFFPIGLVITSIWAGLFLGSVGAGTIGRMRFRDQYRRKTAGGQYGASGMFRKDGPKAGYDKT